MVREVETLHMPLSGLIFQRRSDGCWRCVSEEQLAEELAGEFSPGPDEWTPEDEAIDPHGRAAWGPGLSDHEERWWLLFGDNRDGSVSVTLADGRTPPLTFFGQLWICEWVGITQPAEVSTTSGTHTMFHRVPAYRAHTKDQID